MIARAVVFAKRENADLLTSASCEARSRRSAAVGGGIPSFNTQSENQTRVGDHAEVVKGLMLSIQARKKGMKQGWGRVKVRGHKAGGW